MNARRLAACAVLLACSLPAVAQYKWVAPDGTVNYGDRPPTGARKLELKGAAAAPAPSGAADLPYALRGPVARYPVTLYSSPSCEPCNQLRDHLGKRGIPFSERRLGTAADLEAFKKLGFQDNLLPALTVGRQRQTGYQQHSVDALLDAAGYPRNSVLAKNWRPSPARDLAGSDAAAEAREGTKGDTTADLQGETTAGTRSTDGNGSSADAGRSTSPDGVRNVATDASRTPSPVTRDTGNRLIIPEDSKPVNAAPPLPARSNATGGFSF